MYKRFFKHLFIGKQIDIFIFSHSGDSYEVEEKGRDALASSVYTMVFEPISCVSQSL